MKHELLINFGMAFAQVSIGLFFFEVAMWLLEVKTADLPFWQYGSGILSFYVFSAIVWNFKLDWSE